MEERKYEEIISQIKSLLENERDRIANMANISAVLKQTFDFLWVGFYLVKNRELVLGPFQGPVACTRIKYGKGVCGTAWEKKQTLIVPEVLKFPGHIACSAFSRSEIVVPLSKDGEIFGLLDIDSDKTDDFNERDAQALEIIASFLS